MTDKQTEAMKLAQKAMGLIGADLVCEAAHHEKKDRHEIGEPCPIQTRWHNTFAAIREALAEQPAQPQQEPLRPEDVIVEVLTLHSSGGFAPLKTHGVKLTHKPTGIVVQCSSERSQHRNRKQALRDLERYLYGARPQPTPQRKPLTDEQIDLLINGRGDEGDADYVEPTGDGFGLTDADLVKLVRRVEAAHGIKENT